ncbi:hypothetical protein RMCBS344292_13697 [Rhizopus microsporus]|nr:hypothetical protein RMCBS344292_13697 [Rhizopus microsporus]
MQIEHPEEQGSSLGISKVLKEEARLLEEGRNRDSLTDTAFKKVPSKGASFWTWTRFIISLYYNKLAVNMFGFLTGWKWYNRIDNVIILGALPTPSLIKSLHKHENVKAVINLCEEFPGYDRIYEQCMIKQVRLETPDFCIPSLETIEKGIQQIHEIIQNDEKSSIYLHCKAGRGRSAAIALCYLLATYQLDPFEAQKVLNKKRPQDLYVSEEIRLFYKNLLSKLESNQFIRKPFPF